jgi:antitoxin MazE
MKTTAKIIRIGNSRGVRLSKRVLEEAQLGDEVVLEVRGGEVILRRANHPRAGWEAEAAEMARRGDDDTPELREWREVKSTWDETEWEW